MNLGRAQYQRLMELLDRLDRVKGCRVRCPRRDNDGNEG